MDRAPRSAATPMRWSPAGFTRAAAEGRIDGEASTAIVPAPRHLAVEAGCAAARRVARGVRPHAEAAAGGGALGARQSAGRGVAHGARAGQARRRRAGDDDASRPAARLRWL